MKSFLDSVQVDLILDILVNEIVNVGKIITEKFLRLVSINWKTAAATANSISSATLAVPLAVCFHIT